MLLPEEIVDAVRVDGWTSNNDAGDSERDFVVDQGYGAIDLALEVVSNLEMALKFARPLRAVGVVATVATLFSACQEPTQITLEIRTDISCAYKLSTAIIIGNSDAEAESASPGTVTEMCHPDGRIGAIVLLPRSSKDEPISIRVVMGVGSAFNAESCLLDPNQKVGNDTGCIVARRSLSFIPSTPLYLPVNMRGGCIGVPCLPGQTCALNNKCESSVIVSPGECDEPGKCPSDVMGEGGAGGAGGAASSSSSGQGGASSSSSSSSSASSSNSGGAGGTGGVAVSSSNSSTSGMGGTGGIGGMVVISSSSGMGGVGGIVVVSSSSSSSGMGGMGGMGGMVVGSSSSSSSGMGGMGGMVVGSSSSSSSGMGGMGGTGGMAVSSSSSGMAGSSTSSSSSSSSGGVGGKVMFEDAGMTLDAGVQNPLPDDYENPDRLIPPGILIPGQQYMAPIRRSTNSKQRKAPAKAIPALRLPLYTYPRNVKP